MMIKPKSSNQSGYALVTVLIFLTMLFVILGSLLTIIHVQYRFIRRDGNRRQAVYLAEGGVYRYMAGQINSGPKLQFFPHAFNMDGGEVIVTPSFWGGYLRLNSRAVFRGSEAHVTAVLGQASPKSLRAAVVQGRPDYPLVLTGNTRITGDAFLGPRGVKSGQMRSVKFEGTELVRGKITTFKKPPFPRFGPAFSAASIKSLDYLSRTASGQVFSRNLLVSPPEDTLLKPPGIFVYGDLRLLPGVSASVCTLAATGDIYIEPGSDFGPWCVLAAGGNCNISGSRFTRSVVYAKNIIRIDAGTSGDAQFLTPGNLVSGGSVSMSWPSLFYVNSSSGPQGPECLVVGQNVFIEGHVLMYSDFMPKSRTGGPRVLQEPGSLVRGLLWTNQTADFSGTVEGVVAAGGFYIYLSPTTYINWLKNAVINRPGFPERFPVPIGLGDGEYLIVDWELE